MYKVLIAEDELLVRLGLKNSIDWERFDMKVIADVSDGKAAWEIYQRESPDFIITDLKMPGMDGMELISKIRQQDSNIRIVILSCLEEFELIRKAMSLGVSDYILKLTMTNEEIESVLYKIYSHLKNQSQSQKSSLMDPINRDAVKENKLKNFLFYHIYSEDEFSEMVVDMKLRIQPDRLVLGLMEINHFKKLKEIFKDDKGQLIKLSILNVLNEIMGSYTNGEVFFEDVTRYVFLFNDKKDCNTGNMYTEIIEVLKNIADSMRIYFNISVTFGLSSVRDGYSNLNNMYFQAGKQLENRFLKGPGIYVHGDGTDVTGILNEKKTLLLGLCDFFIYKHDEFKKNYDDQIAQVINQLTGSRSKVQESFHKLMKWTVHDAFPMGDSSMDIVCISKSIDSCETVDEIIEVYRDFILDLNIELQRKKIVCPEIEKAVKYVESHYQQYISLQQIAEYVNLSPNYFSSLFKKEMQMNFTEFLNEYRVEKARKLLLETYLKAYEVAEKVGFSDTTYFTRVFKKVTGQNPNEFRKQWLKGYTEERDNENANKE